MPFLKPTLLLFSVATAHAADVTITETTDQDRPHFKIVTPAATYLYDRAGGGFSHLVDQDGKDWINFKPDPLNKYPDSAAAGYRGLPNAVFRDPDGGAGHPGFTRCVTNIVAPDKIRSVSKSAKWAWTWTFTASHATFEIEKADPERNWWFLYEGTIAGRFAPSEHFWATDKSLPSGEAPNSKSQKIDHWQWIYFGDKTSPRVLFLAQHQPDEKMDTLWYLGSSDGGAPTAKDGMVVFGFGRDPGAKPTLHGTSPQFTIGLLESTDHPAISTKINQLITEKK